MTDDAERRSQRAEYVRELRERFGDGEDLDPYSPEGRALFLATLNERDRTNGWWRS